jgi:hypothetical protein
VDILLAKKNELKLIALAKSSFSTDIHAAELRILQNSVRQGPAETHPADRDLARHVRGSFLRWILNDEGATSLFDKDGLQVASAIIDGDVDLDSSDIRHNLIFDDCVFTKGIHFESAKICTVRILDSTMNGPLVFENAVVHGDIDLSRGFTTVSYVSAYGAQVSGDVLMKEAQLLGEHLAFSLSLNIADIKGIVNVSNLMCNGPVLILGAKVGYEFLGDGAKFNSTVTMAGSTIGVNLNLVNVHSVLPETVDQLSNPIIGIDLSRVNVGGSVYLSGSNLQVGPTSLLLQDAVIAGDVFLTANLQASGAINMSGTRLKQAVYAENSKLVDLRTNDAQLGKLMVLASEITGLETNGAQIGEFGWAGIVNPTRATLNLSNTHIKIFKDEQNSWPSAGHLKIIGLIYDDIELKVPKDRTTASIQSKDGGNDPDDRIAWLHLQNREDQVASQPWMQLAQYVQNVGNPAGVKKVLYTMKRIQAWSESYLTGFKSSVPDYIDENPWRITYFIGVLWLFGSVIFWRARRMNEKAMAPREKDAYDDFSKNDTRPSSQLPPFNPIVYTLENVLPVVKFGQDDAWAPNPQLDAPSRKGWKRWLPRFSYNWLAFARLVLIILGWALALILAGVIGDLFKP